MPGEKILIVGFSSKAWQHTVRQGFLKANLENTGIYCPTLNIAYIIFAGTMQHFYLQWIITNGRAFRFLVLNTNSYISCLFAAYVPWL